MSLRVQQGTALKERHEQGEKKLGYAALCRRLPNSRSFIYFDQYIGKVLLVENALTAPVSTRIYNHLYSLPGKQEAYYACSPVVGRFFYPPYPVYYRLYHVEEPK